MNWQRETEVALAAVTKAAALCTDVQTTLVSSDSIEKNDRSPVTIADLGSQALICAILKDAFPGDPIVGEEDTDQLRANDALRAKVSALVSKHEPAMDEGAMMRAIEAGGGSAVKDGRFWTLDPIDGTKGFLRGDQYAIALALIENGEVVVGVLGCPNLTAQGNGDAGSQGALFEAARGEGTRVRSIGAPEARTVTVSTDKDISKARFCESVESAHAAHGKHAAISTILGIESEPFRIDSQCKYASVSRGDAAIYLRLPSKKGYQEKIWDHAAGVIVVEEAGGRVSDVNGRPLDFRAGETLANNTGVIVTNGLFHDRVLRAVREVGAAPDA